MVKQLEFIQILYEISITIGGSLDLAEMSRKSLNSILRKLNSASGEILMKNASEDEGFQLKSVVSVPKNRGTEPVFKSCIENIIRDINPATWNSFRNLLPLRIEENPGTFLYILELPQFGILILKKRGHDFEPFIIKSLDSILEKLADSCLNCLQNSSIQRMHLEEKHLSEKLAKKALELNKSQKKLLKTMKEMKQVEEHLRHSREILEERVEARTRELKDIHSQMVIQEKMASVGQLAAGVAHEMSNPLNFIRTNFAVMAENFDSLKEIIEEYRKESRKSNNGPFSLDKLEELREKEKSLQIDYIFSDAPELFEESERGFERIIKIIHSIKDFSSAITLDSYTLFNLNQGIENTLTLTANRRKLQCQIIKNLEPLPDILCIPGQINQALLNLVINSIQAIEARGEDAPGILSVRTWARGEYVYCEIRDNGVGIAPEIRSRIFEPFMTTREPGKGTGLGLSVSYDIIVHKHQGNITVECPENGGTTCRIKLPVSPVLKQQAGLFENKTKALK